MAAIVNWLFRLFGGGCILDYHSHKQQGRKTKYQVKGRKKNKKR